MDDRDISFTVDTAALDAALSALPLKLQKQVLRPALQAAGDVILERIKDRAPERSDDLPGGNSLPPGILKEDLHCDVVVSETTGARARIGPSEIAGHVARWQNNGFTLTSHGRKSGRRPVSRKGGKPNPIPGLFFMEGGTDDAAEQALDALTREIASGIYALQVDKAERGE